MQIPDPSSCYEAGGVCFVKRCVIHYILAHYMWIWINVFLTASHVFITSICDNSPWSNHYSVVTIVIWNALGTGDQRQEIHHYQPAYRCHCPGSIYVTLDQGSFHERIFPRCSNLRENSFYCDSDLENCAHATATQMSYYAKYLIEIALLEFGWEQTQIIIEFVLWWKHR